ncbi:uncharacterized protein LOC114881192 [Osmia bicornis bicornis]|uniref:uncharacterized protein LOC114881192 n=1 Tax=Osmia bicornis bicornis TaxID=1437191 RepID=UPI0010F9247A|nr:uncharacterized protein LOC114881192 [Osmia bicornis bicornis]
MTKPNSGFRTPEIIFTVTHHYLQNHVQLRFKVILEVISSDYKIQYTKFAEYTMDTAKRYTELYPWYPMSPTMHKILIHGLIVIQNALLPIGQLSEEAAEARNKHFRMYRQQYARKFSRESCNLDVVNRLLLTSDPLLTGMRPKVQKKTEPFLTERNTTNAHFS